MLNKFKSLAWFIKNPQYIDQAWHVFLRRIKGIPDRYKEGEAIQWCQDNEKDPKDVLISLGVDPLIHSLKDQHEEFFKYAEMRVAKVSLGMGGEGGIDVIYHLTRNINAKRILETGVSFGWSSLAILLAIKDSDDAILYSVDMPYVNMGNEDYVGIAVHDTLKNHWNLLRMSDRKGIPYAIKKLEALDFIHYDSDKSYYGRSWAYPVLWQALAPGGIFMSDDIQDNIAFKEFCEKRSLEPLIFEYRNKYVGIVQKM